MEFKICSRCKIKSKVCKFDKSKTSPDGFDYWCKPCRRKYYKDNYNYNLEKFRERNNRRRAARVSWLAGIKNNTPCVDCGKIYEPHCMDFDHLYGKSKSISRMVLENAPKERVLEEIEKCQLVCILCHNDRTAARQAPAKKYTKYVKRNIEVINRAKDIPCGICGQKFPPHNMHLDHIDPSTKYKNVSQLKSFALETLLLEIEKCQVLCSLCHRRKSIFEQKERNYRARQKNVRGPAVRRKKLYSDDASKECSVCNKILPHHAFTKHKKTKSGLNSWCKPCFNEYRRNKRKAKGG